MSNTSVDKNLKNSLNGFICKYGVNMCYVVEIMCYYLNPILIWFMYGYLKIEGWNKTLLYTSYTAYRLNCNTVLSSSFNL